MKQPSPPAVPPRAPPRPPPPPPAPPDASKIAPSPVDALRLNSAPRPPPPLPPRAQPLPPPAPKRSLEPKSIAAAGSNLASASPQPIQSLVEQVQSTAPVSVEVTTDTVSDGLINGEQQDPAPSAESQVAEDEASPLKEENTPSGESKGENLVTGTTKSDHYSDYDHGRFVKNERSSGSTANDTAAVDYSSQLPPLELLEERISAVTQEMLPQLLRSSNKQRSHQAVVAAAKKQSLKMIRSVFGPESFADVRGCAEAFNVYDRATILGEDRKVLEQLSQQIEESNERNTEAALESLEAICKGHAKLLSYQIEAFATGMENVIPVLQMRLDDYKAAMGRSHDSHALLETASVAHYTTVRDGLEQATKLAFAETIEHMKMLGEMRKKNSQWHLQQIQDLLDEQSTDPERYLRKQQVFHDADSSFSEICDVTFEKLQEDSFFEQKEAQLRCLEEIGLAVHQWKADTVDGAEERMNYAEIGLEAYYMGFAEELVNTVADMREMLTHLCLYERKLVHLEKSIDLREHAIERRAKQQKADVMISMGRKTSIAMRNPRLLMGTRIKALALCSGVPTEDIENILLHMLFPS